MCRHPELNQYISNSLHTVHALLLQVSNIHANSLFLPNCILHYLVQNAIEKVEVLLVSTVSLFVHLRWKLMFIIRIKSRWIATVFPFQIIPYYKSQASTYNGSILDCKNNINLLHSSEDTYLVELEDSMRAALLKINISDTISQTVLPEGQ